MFPIDRAPRELPSLPLRIVEIVCAVRVLFRAQNRSVKPSFRALNEMRALPLRREFVA